jgi:hypothetical protein
MLQRYVVEPTVDAIDHEATPGCVSSDGCMLCLVRSPVQPASVRTSSTIPITRMLGSPDCADHATAGDLHRPYAQYGVRGVSRAGSDCKSAPDAVDDWRSGVSVDR